MSTVLLLHSALGLRPAVAAFAARLTDLGHRVVTPDYYDGNVFDDTGAGIAYRDATGARELFSRVRAQLDELAPDAALAGFSLGAAFAQRLAADRPQARAVILLHHAGAPAHAWSGQPVQVHRYADDPWIEPADVAALHTAVTASGADFLDRVVPGSGHLFTELGDPDANAQATENAIADIHRQLSPDTPMTSVARDLDNPVTR